MSGAACPSPIRRRTGSRSRSRGRSTIRCRPGPHARLRPEIPENDTDPAKRGGMTIWRQLFRHRRGERGPGTHTDAAAAVVREEVARVASKRAWLSVPDRLCPVEVHTRAADVTLVSLLAHPLPCLWATNWARPDQLNRSVVPLSAPAGSGDGSRKLVPRAIRVSMACLFPYSPTTQNAARSW